MTHLGQRLSALIDGELAGSEREPVLLHLAKCGSCRDEVAALRMLKRRLSAVAEVEAGAAGAGLTGRLMGLSEVMDLDDWSLAAGMPSGQAVWPPPAPPGGWPVRRPAQGGALGGGPLGGGALGDGALGGGGATSGSAPNGAAESSHPESGHGSRDDLRGGRLFLGGSLAVFLAGLGTAAFIAGGEAQVQAPPPPVTPSVDVLVVPHDALTGATPAGRPGQPSLWPESEWLRPAAETTFLLPRP